MNRQQLLASLAIVAALALVGAVAAQVLVVQEAFADAKRQVATHLREGTKVPTQHLRTAAVQTNKVLVSVLSKVETKDSKTSSIIQDPRILFHPLYFLMRVYVYT